MKREISLPQLVQSFSRIFRKMIDRCKYFILHSNNTSGANLHELLHSTNGTQSHVISP